MSGYYDDNFGAWDGMDDPETQAFYRQVQEESVEKICSMCERTVWLRPQYDKCDSCCRQMESGMQY